MIPNMGTLKKTKEVKKTQKGFMEALFTSTQRKVLGLLFGQPKRRYFMSELISIAESGSGTVQRELAKLTDSGLVTAEKQGIQKYYQANTQSPIFDELYSIFSKTAGLNTLLSRALEETNAKIELALIFGSSAKGQDKVNSDIDLLIVSDDLTLEVLYNSLEKVEITTRRKVSPVIYTRAEFTKKRNTGNSFLERVLKGKFTTLIGNANDER